MKQSLLYCLLAVILFSSCEKDPFLPYQAKNVVVIVVDGPRYSETWGDPQRTNIPYRSQWLDEGVICENFYNEGGTYTVAGHTAIVTGVYQTIDNTGAEYPQRHSVFQHWIKNNGAPNSLVQIIASKDKLEVLSDCIEAEWKGKHRPVTDCGVNGLGTGYREDSVTFTNAINVIQNTHPRILLICFKGPDATAHAGDSLGYINSIKKTDEYIRQLRNELNSIDFYKDKTAIFITNDHGRHDYDYTGHGDSCNGCRHIEFLAIGPDFKTNYSTPLTYGLTDIAPTIGELMGFNLDTDGEIMWDIFKQQRED